MYIFSFLSSLNYIIENLIELTAFPIVNASPRRMESADGRRTEENFLIEKLFLVQKRIEYGKIDAIFDRSNACHT